MSCRLRIWRIRAEDSARLLPLLPFLVCFLGGGGVGGWGGEGMMVVRDGKGLPLLLLALKIVFVVSFFVFAFWGRCGGWWWWEGERAFLPFFCLRVCFLPFLVVRTQVGLPCWTEPALRAVPHAVRPPVLPVNLHPSWTLLMSAFNPSTPKSDQSQISPATSP